MFSWRYQHLGSITVISLSARKVLLTRSKQENEVLEQILTSKAIPTYSFSLIKLVKTEFDWSRVEKYTDFVITSKLAAKIAAENISHRSCFFVVGNESAKILKSNKKITVAKIYQNSAELHIDIKNDENLISFAYLSGNIIKRSIAEIDRYIIYKTIYASQFNDEVQQKIMDMEIRAIMLYSENCARAFLELCKDSGLCQYIKNITAVVLSLNIKELVKKYFNQVLYTKEPDSGLMLDLICKLYE